MKRHNTSIICVVYFSLYLIPETRSLHFDFNSIFGFKTRHLKIVLGAALLKNMTINFVPRMPFNHQIKLKQLIIHVCDTYHIHTHSHEQTHSHVRIKHSLLLGGSLSVALRLVQTIHWLAIQTRRTTMKSHFSVKVSHVQRTANNRNMFTSLHDMERDPLDGNPLHTWSWCIFLDFVKTLHYSCQYQPDSVQVTVSSEA